MSETVRRLVVLGCCTALAVACGPAGPDLDASARETGVDVGRAAPPTWIEEDTLLASPDESPAYFGFGHSVALNSDGSWAAGGTPDDAMPGDETSRGTESGSVRLFLRTGTAWTQQALLLPSGGAAGDSFGWSVALSANASRALVGAPGDETEGGMSTGSARIFVRSGTTWTEEVTLVASSRAELASFGHAVALSADGDRALVGAPHETTPGFFDVGSARVFHRSGSTWTEEAALVAWDGAAGDYFGLAVALSSEGNRALVGVAGDDTAGGVNAGSARVFVRTGSTWTEEATLVALDAAEDDYFGYSVALSSYGNRALVGADRDDTPRGIDAGSVHMFLRAATSWTEEALLVAPADAPGDPFADVRLERFGESVSLSGDGSRALVGAEYFHGGDIGSGTARVFRRSGSTWRVDATLHAAVGASWLRDPVALSSSGTRALVGAPNDFLGIGLQGGSIRVFALSGR